MKKAILIPMVLFLSLVSNAEINSVVSDVTQESRITVRDVVKTINNALVRQNELLQSYYSSFNVCRQTGICVVLESENTQIVETLKARLNASRNKLINLSKKLPEPAEEMTGGELAMRQVIAHTSQRMGELVKGFSEGSPSSERIFIEVTNSKIENLRDSVRALENELDIIVRHVF